jgi:hypothetical protein
MAPRKSTEVDGISLVFEEYVSYTLRRVFSREYVERRLLEAIQAELSRLAIDATYVGDNQQIPNFDD